MTTPDYTTWLTKQQAADAIGVSTKTIEKLAQERKLEQAVWRPQNRGAARAVYHPDDVARMVQERRREAVPFVLPAGGASNGNGHGAIARTSPFSNFEEARQAMVAVVTDLAAAVRASLPAPPSETSHTSQKSVLTIPEAAAASGWTEAYLRRQIKAGTLKAEKDRGWKIRRKDLEAL